MRREHEGYKAGCQSLVNVVKNQRHGARDWDRTGMGMGMGMVWVGVGVGVAVFSQSQAG